MAKVIQLTPNMSRGQIHLVLGKYKVGEDDFAHVVAHLDSLEALAAEQARAEVLAACIERAKGMKHDEVAPQDDWDKGYVIGRSDAAFAIKTLQPAAKDLEALLREERLDEARWWHKRLPVAFGHNHYCCKRITELKAELEKARVKEKKNGCVQHEFESDSQAQDRHDKRIGAEVLAAHLSHLRSRLCNCNFKHEHDKMFSCRWTVAEELEQLQPASSALEALLEQAHETALPHAAEQLVKSLTEGGEFAVGSPLEKVKKRVEALLQEEREKFRELSNAISRHIASHNLLCGCSECEPFYEAAKKAHALLGDQK